VAAKRFSMLLHGAPGTGKTEFVKHLASINNTKLISKKASDIISPYLGVTEKNLASAFEEAREEEGILFFDEADSFLQDRAGAHRSWEVTQVNELLVQMENHEGLLIMGTNFKDSLDKAALRRFDLEMGFGQILPEKVWSTLLTTLPGIDWQTRPELMPRSRNLADLRFGDLRNVASRLSLGLLDNDPVSVFGDVEQEVRSRGARSKIGFGPAGL